MEKLVSIVLPLKNGTELTVLTDVQVGKSGMLHLQLVYVQPVNSGTDSHVLSVPMVELGTPTLKVVNVPYLQHGTELLVSLVLVEDFITT